MDLVSHSEVAKINIHSLDLRRGSEESEFFRSECLQDGYEVLIILRLPIAVTRDLRGLVHPEQSITKILVCESLPEQIHVIGIGLRKILHIIPVLLILRDYVIEQRALSGSFSSGGHQHVIVILRDIAMHVLYQKIYQILVKILRKILPGGVLDELNILDDRISDPGPPDGSEILYLYSDHS